MKRGILFLIVSLILGALIGTTIGEILGLLISPQARFYSFLTTSLSPSLGPFDLNLLVAFLTFGVKFKLNLCGILGMLLAFLFAFRKI